MNREILESFQALLMNIDTFPSCFYGKVSRFGFLITKDGNIRITIAAQKEEFKTKSGGTSRTYDSEKQVYFSLNIDEVHNFLSSYKALTEGRYENKGSNVPDSFKDSFSVTHFTDKEPSHLVFSAYKAPNNNTPSGYLKVSILPTKGSGSKSISYVFKANEQKIFMDFLLTFTKEYPFMSSFMKSIVLGLRSSIYGAMNNNKNENGNSSNGNGGYKNNNNYSNNKPKPKEEETVQDAPFDVSSSDVDQDSYASSVESFDFS